MNDQEREQLRDDLQYAEVAVFQGMRTDQERIAELELRLAEAEKWNDRRYPGCVTVYDFDGECLGFMGVNAWEASKELGDRWKQVPALVETLRVIAADGDDWAGKVASDALAEWEQA